MEEQAIDRIFCGSFTGLPPVRLYNFLQPSIHHPITFSIRHPVVRVYVSSTYTDMMLEKNVLVTEVYPRLKELCRERYGLEFQGIIHI